MTKSGFTLIELLLVITLTTITIGVAADVLLSLVRSYSKSQVTNEIEQNANYVTLKLSKELRNSLGSIRVYKNGAEVLVPPLSGDELTFEDKNKELVGYKLNTISGILMRKFGATGSYEAITNDDTINGVYVQCANNLCFSLIGTPPPYVVKVGMQFSQPLTENKKAFTANVDLNTTIVVRGTY